ncbi:MAG: nitroreductase family protein [Eubacteriales bacterium]
MTNQLYDAIFHRKSVRKYQMNPLTGQSLAEVEGYALKAAPLMGEIKYKIVILNAAEMGMVSVKAPHYLCFYSEKKEGYLLNAGFILQQVDLTLSVNGYGSCWIGLGKPSGSLPAVAGMEYVIMLGFGRPAEPLYRTDVGEFRRNSLTEISEITGADDLLEPVRLAPSASNTQSWLLTGSSREILLYRKKFNPIKGALYGKFNRIDMGIALCHLWLSLQHQDKQAVFDFKPQAEPKGTEFIAKVSVN